MASQFAKLSKTIQRPLLACMTSHTCRYHQLSSSACFLHTASWNRSQRTSHVLYIPSVHGCASKTLFGAKRAFSADPGAVHVTKSGYSIDFRSDTVTKPTPQMYTAMMNADLGDDVYDGDPTIAKLQEQVADMMKKDASLFVPSGTMANLIAIMAHCQGRGEEILVGDEAHIVIWEQAGVSQIAGVGPRTVKTLPDGTLCLKDMESKIRPFYDPHWPVTRLICLENTHNGTGGRVLPLEYLKQVRELADKHNLKIHIDGARVMNAAVALGVSIDKITQYCDSISMCFSKGLGCPVGSVIVGDKDFITRSMRHRKVLGGGMRQSGILAAAGLVALDKSLARLHLDHENAQTFAKGLVDMKSPVFTAYPDITETNMVLIHINGTTSAMDACKLLADALNGEEAAYGEPIQVKSFPVTPTAIRAVMHQDVSAEDVQLALKKCKFVSDLLSKEK